MYVIRFKQKSGPSFIDSHFKTIDSATKLLRKIECEMIGVNNMKGGPYPFRFTDNYNKGYIIDLYDIFFIELFELETMIKINEEVQEATSHKEKAGFRAHN